MWTLCIIRQRVYFFIMSKIYRCPSDNGLWVCKFVARGIHELYKHHETPSTMKISWLLLTLIIQNRLLCSKLCNILPGLFLQKDIHSGITQKIMPFPVSEVCALNSLVFNHTDYTYPLYSIQHNCKIMKVINNVYSWHHELQFSSVIFHELHQGTLVICNISP